MHNYGFDESQEEAIRWAINSLDRHLEAIKKTLYYLKWDIETSKKEAYTKRLIDRAVVHNERLIKLTKHRETLANMISVTESNKPMYSDNEGRNP